MKYLDGCAKKLLWAENRYKDIGRCLGFTDERTGSRSTFGQYETRRAKEYAADRTDFFASQGLPVKKAAEKAAGEIWEIFRIELSNEAIEKYRSSRKK